MSKAIKKYSGITLIEVLVYMALFGVVFALVVGVLIQTREQNRRARDSIKIEQNMMFIDEHINMVFNDVDSINAAGSVFDNDTGTLQLTLNDASTVEYERVGGTLNFTRDSTTSPLSNNAVTVSQFRIEQVLDEDSNLIGVRVSCEVNSQFDSDNSKSWSNLYYIQ
ncbi:MAG: type II secretion system protein [Candidatus Dojkabacteria bacterium]|nr:MAG: type II secretion system protein [Candidatus Dojkabacteria bacterium]